MKYVCTGKGNNDVRYRHCIVKWKMRCLNKTVNKTVFNIGQKKSLVDFFSCKIFWYMAAPLLNHRHSVICPRYSSCFNLCLFNELIPVWISSLLVFQICLYILLWNSSNKEYVYFTWTFCVSTGSKFYFTSWSEVNFTMFFKCEIYIGFEFKTVNTWLYISSSSH